MILAFSFLLLVLDDTESKRKFFFIVYTISSILTYFACIYIANDFIGSSNVFSDECKKMKTEGRLETMMHVSTLEDCQDKMRSVAQTMTVVLFILILLPTYHFCQVTYAHYRNYERDAAAES